jgi:threonine/homoserine/homoserine lactone efflux protein
LATVVHIVIAFGSSTRLIALSKLGLSLLQITDGVFILFMAKQLIKEAHVPAKAQMRPTIKAIFWAEFLTGLTNPKAITFFVPLFPTFMCQITASFCQEPSAKQCSGSWMATQFWGARCLPRTRFNAKPYVE